MNFKNLCIYRIRPEALPCTGTIEMALMGQPFSPCGATEPQRVGWMPAIDDDGISYTRRTSDSKCVLIRLREQRRLLPSGVIREQLEEQVRAIQDREGRKLGKKEVARLKDELILTLLPRAFTKTSDTLALIYPEKGLIMVGAASMTKAELVLNALRLALGSLSVARLAFSAPTPQHLTSWMHGGWTPHGLTLGDSCEIVDEEGVVRCSHIELASDEVRKHLELGREVRKLQVSYQDSLTFTIQPDARLTGIRMSERLTGELDAQYGGDKLANLDAELHLWSETLGRMVPALLRELGESV